MNDETQRKKKRFMIIAATLLVLIGLIYLGQRGNNIDSKPHEGTAADYSTQARIVGGEELFMKVGGDTRYDLFTKDMFVFGKKSFNEYKDDEGVVGFKITSDLTESGDEIRFEGKYGSSGNKIEVKLKRLPNNRLQTSITDTKTKLNIDSDLPSNSKRNQVIATMPLDKEGYGVEYLQESDKFLINIFSNNPNEIERSVKEFAALLGVPDLTKENYSLTYRGGLTGGSIAE